MKYTVYQGLQIHSKIGKRRSYLPKEEDFSLSVLRNAEGSLIGLSSLRHIPKRYVKERYVSVVLMLMLIPMQEWGGGLTYTKGLQYVRQCSGLVIYVYITYIDFISLGGLCFFHFTDEETKLSLTMCAFMSFTCSFHECCLTQALTEKITHLEMRGKLGPIFT